MDFIERRLSRPGDRLGEGASLAALALSACVLGAAGPAQAVDFTVSNGADSGPGTYRNAVNQSNAAPGTDRIVFAVPTVTINNGFTVTDNTQIGVTGQPVTISGTGTQVFGFGTTSTIGSNVTIRSASQFPAFPTAVALLGSSTLFMDGKIIPASGNGIDVQGSNTRLFLGPTSLIETGPTGTGITSIGTSGLLVSLIGGTIHSGNVGINLPTANAGMSGGVIEAGNIGVLLGPGSTWTTGLLGGRITGGATA